MSGIKDELYREIFYWPIPNLKAGETSEVLIINIDAPTTDWLRATQDDRAKVWAKWNQFPLNPFIDLSNGPGINLSGIAGPYAEFSIYVEAISPMNDAFYRVPLMLVSARNNPAGWLS